MKEKSSKEISFVLICCNLEVAEREQILCQFLLSFIAIDNPNGFTWSALSQITALREKEYKKECWKQVAVITLSTIKIVTQTYPIGKDLSTACPFMYRVVIVFFRLLYSYTFSRRT